MSCNLCNIYSHIVIKSQNTRIKFNIDNGFRGTVLSTNSLPQIHWTVLSPSLLHYAHGVRFCGQGRWRGLSPPMTATRATRHCSLVTGRDRARLNFTLFSSHWAVTFHTCQSLIVCHCCGILISRGLSRINSSIVTKKIIMSS